MYPGERFNTYSHLSGLVLAAAGLVMMLLKAEEYGDGYRTFSVSVYGISLFLLYLSSSLYHGIKAGRLKSILKKVDHCMIYVLIAGSYTPFAMVLAVMKTLTTSLPAAGLVWLAAGGILYSIGIYWFVNDKKIRHGHGIWHLFVLGGSITQFISVYGYVI